MKTIIKLSTAFILCLCLACSNNEKNILGTWNIVDMDFGTSTNPLLLYVIFQSKPTSIEFNKESFNVLNEAGTVEEQNSYTFTGNKLFIGNASSKMDTVRVEFISQNEIKLHFDESKSYRLVRKS